MGFPIDRVVSVLVWSSFLTVVLLTLCNRADASEYRLLHLDYMGIEYKKHTNYRDPYFTEYETVDGVCTGQTEEGLRSEECMAYGAAALFNLSLLTVGNSSIFWRNEVDMDATNKQVRQVGWFWEAGLSVQKKLEIQYRHHSRHVLEDTVGDGSRQFPLRDEIAIRLNLYGEK